MLEDDRVVRITLEYGIDGAALLNVILRGETEWMHFPNVYLKNGDSAEFLDGQDMTTWADVETFPRKAAMHG